MISYKIYWIEKVILLFIWHPYVVKFQLFKWWFKYEVELIHLDVPDVCTDEIARF